MNPLQFPVPFLLKVILIAAVRPPAKMQPTAKDAPVPGQTLSLALIRTTHPVRDQRRKVRIARQRRRPGRFQKKIPFQPAGIKEVIHRIEMTTFPAPVADEATRRNVRIESGVELSQTAAPIIIGGIHRE